MAILGHRTAAIKWKPKKLTSPIHEVRLAKNCCMKVTGSLILLNHFISLGTEQYCLFQHFILVSDFRKLLEHFLDNHKQVDELNEVSDMFGNGDAGDENKEQ